jgi:2-amino-4-hydroxy-6-hydroxymethyldihydropteridine diphosphokinase
LTNHLYLIALGSNQRHPVLGLPHRILTQAIVALEMVDIDVFFVAPIRPSSPMGPSRRRYANTAALIATSLDPAALLTRLHSIEDHFGRRRMGQRWQARTLDLDIILWSGGIWSDDRPQLCVPHREMRNRTFVLEPAAAIVPDWRDPVTGLTMRQIFHRHKRGKPLDHSPNQH